MEKKKRRQKSCWEIALARARLARCQKKHPILIGWAFIAALLSIRTPFMQPATPQQFDSDNGWSISDYERGFSTTPKQPRERYNEQPTLKRLMRDLRRPAAREDAKQFLLARIDDVGLRGWIIDQIHQERINRLAVHVRHGMHDAKVITSWQAEFDAEKTTANKAINEALTNVPSPQI
ncbi:hypothetical protein P8H26_09255 [Pseudochrobactrum sp. sp1633]|uniref:hypothetical protein n=1 Tax=Pseudochrobactrum sp. sp1633 TaxID=3036706 RepID=UPI0025A60C78|nr:hypothetical protein [Pseudochrobactrum sp. sp1633]MDM8345579.1 hypothetical protein [Pseudochrobactrum sp. sp1633]